MDLSRNESEKCPEKSQPVASSDATPAKAGKSLPTWRRRHQRTADGSETSVQAVEPNRWEENQAEAWQAYRENPNEQTAWAVAVTYEANVRLQASKRLATLASSSLFDLDDLIMIGLLAVKECVPKFDVTRRTKFMSFAQSRMMGAMIDEIRKLDWTPRLVRGKQTKLEKARQSFFELHGRQPEDVELMDELQIDEPGFAKLHSEASSPKVGSLYRPQYETDSGRSTSLHDLREDGGQEDPKERLKRKELLAKVAQNLNRNERLIVILYYYEDLTMKEIGKHLDLSESRVSQMHASILKRLRQRPDLKAA